MAKVGTVLSDKALVKQLVGTLCYSKGGPLPDWDDVYDSHCGVSGDIVEERKDLGCIQIAFSDGHKYWYPIKAITRGPGNGRAVPSSQGQGQGQGRSVPDLMKAKLLDITRRCFGDKVDVKGFVKMRSYTSQEEEDWAVGIEALFKEIAPQLDTHSRSDVARISDFQYSRRMGELERDLNLAHKLIHKLQDERRADLETLEAAMPSGGREDAALHEIIRLIRNENDELRLQLQSADQGMKIARKEAAELARQGKLLEDTLKEQAKSIEMLKTEVEDKRKKERDAPLLDFRSLRETPNTRAKRRANTPPARVAGNAGMRRAATTHTQAPPSATKRGPTFSVITTRSISPSNVRSRTPVDSSKKITRSESLGTRGRRPASSRRTQSPDQFHFGGVTFSASNNQERPRRYERSHTTGSVRPVQRPSAGLPPPPPGVDAVPTSRALKYDI